jgi:hypothetical protein
LNACIHVHLVIFTISQSQVAIETTPGNLESPKEAAHVLS